MHTPNFIAVSISSIVASPLSTILIHSCLYGKNNRFTIKPVPLSVRAISTNFINGTGLKKCRPAKRSGQDYIGDNNKKNKVYLKNSAFSLSISRAVASPRSNIRTASCIYGTNKRLTIKPGVSLHATPTLSISLTNCRRSSNVLSLVPFSVRTISTNFINGFNCVLNVIRFVTASASSILTEKKEQTINRIINLKNK
ncbi:hypothetical protein DERP_012832 [Dermatophagoides pteronyssinus]|uniref:Uncharacterized protein n=1 Tax=Dermatophagoides pteronyssinus TaxID=6956 RepID=A0ABQ8JF83_DERPT|nr:hypothetical protein DERP_012832 [Dermatophagoides pteronyssinus]